MRVCRERTSLSCGMSTRPSKYFILRVSVKYFRRAEYCLLKRSLWPSRVSSGRPTQNTHRYTLCCLQPWLRGKHTLNISHFCTFCSYVHLTHVQFEASRYQKLAISKPQWCHCSCLHAQMIQLCVGSLNTVSHLYHSTLHKCLYSLHTHQPPTLPPRHSLRCMVSISL